jgi:hypothetical protein
MTIVSVIEKNKNKNLRAKKGQAGKAVWGSVNTPMPKRNRPSA